ncbi:putative fiber protein [Escherichia phage LAMP]|uniref:Putative fiber protein n=1 Tax=Escherichia phage LAMP TaxID=2065191 RepID=A0A2I6PD03_9CAUD|nr:putative fiber protein [Escherichia phage LAMP]
MIVYNNQAPDAVNNVGQFGATEGSIGAYKQAAEYAADSKYWALLAESKFGTIDDLIAEVERLYQQGVLMKQDIEDLKQDFRDQDARLMSLIAQTNAAVSDANNAVALINQKLIEVQNQLDVLLGMSVDVTTLPPGTPATGSFNPNTGAISLGIPEGDPGKDGSVKDLDTAPTGVPVLGDVGFYVDKDDNTVHKTSLENIANLIPSVRSISVNGGPSESGEVALTLDKSTVGLSNVENVASYSKEVVDNKVDGFIKTYSSKAEADADAVNREAGETVLVWEDTQYVFYKVAADKILDLDKTEPRVITVNSRIPDSSGNIDITIPTGNPSLYLGELLMFPYDPSRPISYPGILPADGRLVSKDLASDLGASLVSGQLPVVSETEWQAGAKQYYSWGKLADGLTDADSTNYINIRLPDWTGGEAIRSPSLTGDTSYDGKPIDQKPYIVTINGISPNDITGNVNITAANIGALAKSGGIMDGNLVLNKAVALRRIKDNDTQVNMVSRSDSDDSVLGDHLAKTVIASSETPIFSKPDGDYKFYTEDNKPTNVDVGAAGIDVNGVNSDIKTFTQKVTFQQPVTVADAVGDYDAVTLRQLRNQGGGGGGPTMNGISNFNIGDFRLVDSRAFIQANDVVSDGQLLNRADWPELWAYAQMLSPITDSEWLATPSKRGRYSLGDGATTFRVPDRNGVQAGSINELFGRGDGGVSSAAGDVFENGAPNITGSFRGYTYVNNNPNGAFTFAATSTNVVNTTSGTDTNTQYGVFNFGADKSNAAYGRSSKVRPDCFVGVWVIRASGGFVAANTQWSVINSDDIRPSDGTTVTGGNLISDYRVGTESEGSAEFKMQGTVGGSYSARIGVYNKTSSNGTTFDFTEAGNIETPRGRVLVKGDYGVGVQGGTVLPASNYNQFITDSDGNSPWAAANGGGFQTSYAVNRICQFWISLNGSAYVRTNTINNNPKELKTNLPWTTLQNAGTSDANVKDIGDDLDLNVALSNIKALEFKNFTYKSDKNKSPRRGVIAQQAEQVDPQYVHSAEKSGVMTLDTNPLLLDALAAIKLLSAKVEELEKQLAAK